MSLLQFIIVNWQLRSIHDHDFIYRFDLTISLNKLYTCVNDQGL